MSNNIPLTIDLNCDLGEGFGEYVLGSDAELLRLVSSANIACGFHAGDPAVMRKTVRLCMEHNVAIGAHPGLPDLQGFGRREMRITSQEAYDLTLYQIGALEAFVRTEGGRLHHVKPHGALYNMAARERELAEAIARAVLNYDPRLILYGLSGSELPAAASRLSIPSVSEAFADRSYRPDGSLTPRSAPNAVLSDEEQAVSQALRMVRHRSVHADGGSLVPIEAGTICIHGDSPQAVSFAARLHAAFIDEGIRVAAPAFQRGPH